MREMGRAWLGARPASRCRSRDVDRITVRYASPFGLMHDLRRMGATNAAERAPGAGRSRRAPRSCGWAQIYTQRFSDADGRIRASFEIVWLSGWAPHPDQQQPLKPGSAKAAAGRRASDAEEISAGEKPGGR